MAKRRKQTISSPMPSPAPTVVSRPDASARTRWLSGIFLLALAGYLVFYCGTDVTGNGAYRYQAFVYLLLPDQLLAEWCGGEFGNVRLLDRAGPLAVGVLVWTVASLLGSLVLGVLRIGKHLDRLETVTLAIGLGLSGVSLFTLMVGLLGGLGQPVWFILFGLALLAAVVGRVLRGRALTTVDAARDGVADPAAASEYEHVVDVSQADRESEGQAGRVSDAGHARRVPHQGWWQPRWWWASVPFVGILLSGSVLPPLDYDVLEYHLQVPKQWYQQGAVTFLPHNVYGNMPLGGEMLAVQAMALMRGEFAWWWGAVTGKLLMASYTLLTTVLLFAAGRRFFSRRAGIFAALIYISTVGVVDVSCNGLNEGVVAFYLLASFYVGKIWWDQQREGERPQWGLLILAGLLAGASVACKYTSLVFVFLPLLVLVVGGSRGPWRQRGQTLLVFLLAVTAACGLWLGKNWALTGNPTYPLLVSVFGGKTRTPEKDAQWRRAHQVPRDAQGHRYSLTQAGKAAIGLAGRSRPQNLLVVPFAALLLLNGRRCRNCLFWTAILAFILAVWWLATHRLDRFWIPVIPIMALLSGRGATWSSTLVWRRIASVVLGAGLVANFLLIVAPVTSGIDCRFLVSLEQLRDDPRMALVPGAHRPIAFQYLAEHVPPGSQVLVVGDAAVFDLRVPAMYNTCFDDCVFENLFRNRSADERRTRLAQEKISHVYIDWAELRRFRSPGNYGYSEYVTPQLVHGELGHGEMEGQQRLLRRVDVPELDASDGEIFEVIAVKR